MNKDGGIIANYRARENTLQGWNQAYWRSEAGSSAMVYNPSRNRRVRFRRAESWRMGRG